MIIGLEISIINFVQTILLIHTSLNARLVIASEATVVPIIGLSIVRTYLSIGYFLILGRLFLIVAIRVIVTLNSSNYSKLAS